MAKRYLVETETFTMLGLALGLNPVVTHRRYRWRWLARLNAWLLTGAGPGPFVLRSVVREL